MRWPGGTGPPRRWRPSGGRGCGWCCGSMTRRWRGCRGRRCTTRPRGRTCAGRTSWSGTSRSPRCRRRCGSGRRCGSWAWSPPPAACPPLDVEKEQDQLARALARPVSQGLAELCWAPSATWADLQDLLLDGEWHVLHFIGHGDFDPGRDEGVLALTREDGRADLVAAHRLVDLLRQARPMPRLVVLNSCSGAAAGISDLFSGTAAALVRGGVSAVAAMQYEISDPAAVAFARGFYAAIARGRGVDDAVSSGRVAILGTGDRTLEWVTPVLYLRGHDTRLFTLPAPRRRHRPRRHRQPRRPARQHFSPAAAGLGPHRDSPAERAGARAPQPAAGSGPAITPGPHPDRPHQRGLRGGVQPGRAAARHRQRRRDGAGVGPGHRRLPAHPHRPHRSVRGVAFSPDGRLLATASDDTDGAAVGPGHRRPPAHPHRPHRPVYGVAFSPDGRLLATASDDETARLWDPATGDCLRTLTGHTGSVCGVAFSPDGRLLATASDDETARVWDPATGGACAPSPATPARSTGWRSARTGGCSPPPATTRRRGCGTRPPAMPAHPHRPHRPGPRGGVQPGRALLATASGDKTARVWDPATGETCAPSPATPAGPRGGVQPGRAAARHRQRRQDGAAVGLTWRP